MFHSDVAKSNTKKQVDGIISFLEKQLIILKKEKIKYEFYGVMGKYAVDAVEHNIIGTESSINYYTKLKEKYKKDDLI